MEAVGDSNFLGVPDHLQGRLNELKDVIQHHIYNHLELEDLLNLREVSKQHLTTVTSYKPHYDLKRKIDRAANRFMDRPLWQQVAIVALVVIFSPVILVVKGPHIYRKYCHERLKSALVYIEERALRPSARFINEEILTRVASLAKAVFVTLPSKIYAHVLKPGYDHILVPGAELVRAVAKAIFVTLPRLTYTHVLRPSAVFTYRYVLRPSAVFSYNKVLKPSAVFSYTHVLRPSAIFTYQKVLTPGAKLVRIAAKALFVTLPSKIYAHVLRPGYDHILAPVATVAYALAVAVFVTMPSKVYNGVLAPAGRFTYDVVLAPAGKLISEVAYQLFYNLPVELYSNVAVPVAAVMMSVLTPLAQLVQSVAYEVFVELPAMVWNAAVPLVIEAKDALVEFRQFVAKRLNV